MGKHEVLSSGAFYTKKNWNIFKCHIRDRNNLNIDFLFHLVQCFKTISPSTFFSKKKDYFSLTYIHEILCISIHHFHLHFYSFIYIYIYISTYSPSCHLISQQIKNDFIYLQSFDDTYLALSFLSHLILTCMSWLQPRKEACILYWVTTIITILMLRSNVVDL